MAEKVSRPLHTELPTRRDFIRAGTYLGAAALAGTTLKAIHDSAMTLYEKYTSIGDDYSNDPFFEAVGARPINRSRLNELLADAIDTPLRSQRVRHEKQDDMTALAEYRFEVDKTGPVHAEFNGLHGDGISLAIFNVAVDEGEEFLVPVLQSLDDQPPVTVQLGTHDAGEHRLRVRLEHATAPIDPDQIMPYLVRGSAGTIGSFIDMQQPDIYLQDYENMANNFPRKAYAFIYEMDDDIAVAYWQECFDEDREYGLFGTTLRQLIETKNRPTDFDWDMEKVISKTDGSLLKATFAAPYHTRKELLVQPGSPSHTPLYIASSNNNVRPVISPSLHDKPKIRFRPQPIAEEERWDLLHRTDPSAARYSLCENYKEGVIDPADPVGAAILATFNLDTGDCRN